jgi:prephenate dehydratase
VETAAGSGRRVAIQGERGSFSHSAAQRALGPELEVVCEPSFDALFATVSEGRAERGLVPIENSLTGSLHENYDRLRASGLAIVGETHLRVRQCLIAAPGASLAGLRRVASHPVALAQCRSFFAAHPGIEPVVAYDTAGSVRELMRTRDVAAGAIAARLAAELYGAAVLREGLEDDPENYTRFLVLAREAVPTPGADKTTLLLRLPHVPGSLHRALGAFAERGVDLAKIESRPLRGRPGEYVFYLDVLGDPAGAVGAALAELRARCDELRVLGSYRSGPRSQAGRAGS